jgi:putative PIN family toxin of toxin-antitoxin system
MRTPRLVLDTSVLIAALTKPRGAAGRIVRAWRSGDIEVVASDATNREAALVLGGRWLTRIAPRDAIEALLRDLRERSRRVRPRAIGDLDLRDEGDLRLVEAAVAGAADYVVTADREVLNKRGYGGVEFVTPSEFWKRLAPVS